VARAATAVEVARLEIRKQKGALLPVLTADGAWLKQRSSFPLDQYGFFALRLTVPVYQGGEVKARVAVANERLHQAELDLEAARRTVREEVRRAIADLAAADAELALAQEQKTAAEAEYQQADELYRAQELTALDARVAETSLADARRAVATGELDRDLAELQVWAAAGLLAKNLQMEDVR
jgi:outer membrane protein